MWVKYDGVCKCLLLQYFVVKIKLIKINKNE